MSDGSKDGTDDRGDDVDVLAQLRAANPVVVDSKAHTQPAAEALFEEIVMSDTLTPPTDRSDRTDSVSSGQAAPAGRSKRRRAVVAAVAAAALVATTAVAVWPSGGRSAAAAVRAAAESTEAATSGTVELSIDFSDDLEATTVQIVTAFFGDDLDATIRLSGDVNGSTVTEDSRMRVVGDRLFVQGLLFAADVPTWYETDVANRDELLALVGVPTAITSGGADGLVALLVGAGEIERADDDTYAASITVGDARRLSEVPAGLTFVTADDSDLADDQVLDLVAHVGDDGRLDSLVVELVEQGSETNASARIEVGYRDLDEGAPIEAPTEAEPMPADLSNLPVPAELEDPVRVLTEFIEENPDVCVEVVDPSQLVSCLRAEGYDEVADALELLESIADE